MKNFIGIIFVTIILLMFIAPLSDAATGDIWDQCTSAIYKTVKEGKTCCKTNDAANPDQWVDNPKTECKLPTATFNSPPTGWQGPKGGSFFVSFTFQADNGLTTCQWKVSSNDGVKWVQTFPASGWYNFICSGKLPVSTSDSLEMGANDDCRDSGTGRCKLELRVSDGLNTVTNPQTFDIDITPPAAGTYTLNGKSSGIVYSNGQLNHVWSGFSDAHSGLNSFEVWKASYSANNCNENNQKVCSWSNIHTDTTNPGGNTWSGDSITSDYMYGWHSSDKVANWIKETTPIAVRYDTTINPPTYKTPESQRFSLAPTLDIDFSDNFDLKEMHYQFNGVGGTWTQIDSNPSGADYKINWAVASSDWNPLPDGTHYIYFKIIDEATPTPGNTHQTANNAAAFELIKDTTPPITSVNSVEGDISATFYDTSPDGSTAIVVNNVNGESGMSCRWYNSDVSYDPGSGTGCTTSGHQATCSVPTATEGGYIRYIACADNAIPPNGQSSSQNLDVDWIVDYTPPSFTIQYYSDSGLTTSLGNNPRLAVGAYYLKIAVSEASNTPIIVIAAEGTANDVVHATTTSVSGNDYKYTRTISFDSAAVGVTLEDISLTATDPAGNTANNVNPTNEGTKAAYTDTAAPVISITSVGGDTTSPYVTTDTTPDIILGTNEQANCKYSTTSGTAYDSMTNSFSPTPPSTGTSHSTTLQNLASGTYTYYARCRDTANNKNTADLLIPFTVCTRSNPTVTVNPPASQQGEPGDKKTYSLTVANNDNNCGTETFDLTAGCPAGWTCTFTSSPLSIVSGSSASATLSLTSPASATTGINVINVEAKNSADTSFKNSASATYEIICIYKLSIKPMPNFNLATKHGDSTAVQNTWAASLQDIGSSSSCPLVNGKLEYSIPSITTSGSCHSQTGIYSGSSTPPGGLKPALPFKFSVAKNGDLNNAFKVFVKRQSSNFCTISFNIVATQPGTMQLDPSFTVGAPGASTQPPQVSFFDFSGDSVVFKVNWEAFYPDEPFRTMEVKCGLNCDPRIEGDCTAPSEVCSPYPAVHGAEEIKKGGCSVSSPAFNFATDKVMCLFYDPATPSSNTFINHGFTAVDFDVQAASEVTTTVGHPFELKIDVANKGELTDSYRVDLTAPATIDVSPATITTPTVETGKLVSAFAFVTPLVEQSDKITVKVTSLTSGKAVTKNIDVNPGLFALPEFGLVGFLQIIAIAAIVYFLLTNRIKLKKKRKRR